MEDQRIHDRIADQVVGPRCLPHEAASIIDLDGNPLVVVRSIRVISPPDLIEHRIDLHRINMLRSLGQHRLHVVARTRPDDHYILEGRAPGVSIEQMG